MSQQLQQLRRVLQRVYYYGTREVIGHDNNSIPLVQQSSSSSLRGRLYRNGRFAVLICMLIYCIYNTVALHPLLFVVRNITPPPQQQQQQHPQQPIVSKKDDPRQLFVVENTTQHQQHQQQQQQQQHEHQPPQQQKQQQRRDVVVEERCAINIFGLPRAFASLVLPSMIQNVIQPNSKYHCDYFVHYYNITNEAPGRSGAGGHIRAHEILLLEQAVAKVNSNMAADTTTTSSSSSSRSPSRVFFTSDTADDFENKYATLLNKIHTTTDPQGRPLYFPWKEKSYTNTSVNNIIKMWHSIDAAWQLMQHYADNNHQHDDDSYSINYTRVAMMRSDVVYVTPVDIWAVGGKRNTNNSSHSTSILDQDNEQVVIPGFARWPVSDRLVYGPYHAVQEWAANRISTLDDHVQMMLQQHPGQGMHSERYVKYNIIPRIQKLKSRRTGRPFQVVESETICFFRARADESVWITDCDPDKASLRSITQHWNDPRDNDYRKALVESVVGRACGQIFKKKYLDCRAAAAAQSHLSFVNSTL